jgi:protein TonB
MRLSSGKRIGQSGRELGTAAFFSFFLHMLLLAAVLLYVNVTPKKYFPPFYEVNLVSQPSAPTEIPPAPPKGNQLASLHPAVKAAPKEKKAAPKPVKAHHHANAMPELARTPSKRVPTEPEQPKQQAAAPAATGSGVAVTTPQQDFKYGYYLNQVRDKISQNWSPPPDGPEAKARVIFSINRSGWVGEVNLDPDHSTGTFGFKQAAIRAIRLSNPFPPLPPDFAKQTLEFSVDLMAEQ